MSIPSTPGPRVTAEQVELVEVATPATHDGPEAENFRRLVDVRNRVYIEVYGTDDLTDTPQDLLANWKDPHNGGRRWLVLVDDELVGRAGIDLPLEEGSIVSYVYVELLTAHWGRGIGSIVLPQVESVALSEGRTIAQGWAVHRPTPGGVIEPPTGFGSVPAQEHCARALVSGGYSLEQVERISEFVPRDMAAVARQRDEAIARAGADYEYMSWLGATPPERVEQLARMRNRMSVDVPAGGLEVDEEKWDAERIRDFDERNAFREFLLTSAILHRPSDEIVAYSVLAGGISPKHATHQWDTFVLAAHRGHRLGLLVKTAGLVRWRELWPESPRVITFNAEENRPMLDVNEQIGFTPLGYEGAWKKTLA